MLYRGRRNYFVVCISSFRLTCVPLVQVGKNVFGRNILGQYDAVFIQ